MDSNHGPQRYKLCALTNWATRPCSPHIIWIYRSLGNLDLCCSHVYPMWTGGHMEVHLMVQPGVDARLVIPVISAFKHITNITNPALREHSAELVNLGYWQAADYCVNNKLVPRKSINWFIESAYNNRLTDSTINAGTLLGDGQVYSMESKGCPLFIFVVNYDLVHPTAGWCLGATTKFFGSVINVSRFLNFDLEATQGLIKTLSVHEIGHLFGLVSEQRGEATVEALGLHCTTDRCAMRQGPSVDDWVRMTNDVKGGAIYFCIRCQTDLYRTAEQWRIIKNRSA